jgi:hypothetical protein
MAALAAASLSTNNVESIAESKIGEPSTTLTRFGTDVTNALVGAANHLISATQGENPTTGINTDASGQWLGDINFAPNYNSCSGGL